MVLLGDGLHNLTDGLAIGVWESAETNRGQRSRLLNFQPGSPFLLQHTASFAFILYATHLSILWELGRDSEELGMAYGKGSLPKKSLVPITIYCINSLERHG